MKVKELYIKKYHQFEDFHLNLTYPEGHKKAGQPLDKVCFIGQSGTGKTSLLGIFRIVLERLLKDGYFWIKDTGECYMIFRNNLEDFENIFNKNINLKFSNLEDTGGVGIYDFSFSLDDTVSINTHTNINSDYRLFNFPCDIKLPKIKSIENEKNVSKLFDNQVIDFEDYHVSQIWQTINEAIIEDRELEIKKSLEISKILRNPKVSKVELDKATDEFRKWREEKPNPIQDLADNYLDKIIGRFNLKVKTELDFEKKEDIETIKIQQKNGKEIPFEALSTGTKQVILTALPLYSLKPKDSIILFDEPERSLYPDIQAEIVKFYTDMAPECQFFFATHSPLVASSFEPWEIVELKFNEETGNVYQELYYDSEKERHVDNYTIDPRYLRWDGILKKVFDLEKEGNDMRMSELVNLATLESQLKNNNLSIEQKKEKFEEYKKLATLLNWDLN